MFLELELLGDLEQTRFEKIHSVIFDDSKKASLMIAKEISDLIKEKQKQKKNCVLGLATGSSPISVYQELVRLHNQEGLSFKNVITFNLDEYYPMSKDDINSYNHFMNIHLFDHIDILKENINIPDGSVPIEKINDYCNKYSMVGNKRLMIGVCYVILSSITTWVFLPIMLWLMKDYNSIV